MFDTEKLEKCFEENGIYLEIKEDEEYDIDIRDFIESSIQFISIIVEIENAFQIEFPDDYLSIETFSSILGLIKIIESLENDENNI